MAQKVFSSELVPSLRAYDAIRVSPKDLRPDPVLNGRVELPNIANFKRDFLDPRIGQVQPITIKKGLTGAKPENFCHWVLDLLGHLPGDRVDDLYTGTGIMRTVAAERATA